MLSEDQAAEVEAHVYAKVRALRVTRTTRAYARDLAGLLIMRWQKAGEVPQGDFGVEVMLAPFSIHADWLPGHGPRAEA